MQRDSSTHLTAEALTDPLLSKLSDIAAEVAGIRFAIVFPQGYGWAEAQPAGEASRHEFCRLIQSNKEGAKHCKMCHVLMAVSACNQGFLEHRCHAGACVLLVPVPQANKDVVVVLSTCMFTEGMQTDAWKEARARGKKLGLDEKQLKEMYSRLPKLTPEQRHTARAILAAVGEAVREIGERMHLEGRIHQMTGRKSSGTAVQHVVEKELKSAVPAPHPMKQKKTSGKLKKKGPVVIDVVADLVRRKPNIPFTVAEVSAAARMTPNHFSAIFRQYTGQSFSAFLTERRMLLAKGLLRDLTLNIGEVSMRAGYDDPSYFSRLFKQQTGKTPRAWRRALRTKRSRKATR